MRKTYRQKKAIKVMDYLTHERYVASLQNRIDGLKERLAYEKARNAELEKMVARYVQVASVPSKPTTKKT